MSIERHTIYEGGVFSHTCIYEREKIHDGGVWHQNLIVGLEMPHYSWMLKTCSECMDLLCTSADNSCQLGFCLLKTKFKKKFLKSLKRLLEDLLLLKLSFLTGAPSA